MRHVLRSGSEDQCRLAFGCNWFSETSVVLAWLRSRQVEHEPADLFCEGRSTRLPRLNHPVPLLTKEFREPSQLGRFSAPFNSLQGNEDPRSASFCVCLPCRHDH
jgi:hypothetical protein